MRNKIVLIGVIALAAYVLGGQARKSKGKHYEDFRHQVERLWTDPQAVKSRAKKRKQLAKNSRRIAKSSIRAIQAKANS